MNFLCPICSEELINQDKCLVCKNKHSFDKAKSGYVNLLTVNHKNSKIPGDNKIMVNARRDFLSKGYYKVLSDNLNKIIYKHIKTKKSPQILDAGCGEGYYLNNIYSFLTDNNINPDILGIDISKFALNSASKVNKNIMYGVASIFNLPIKTNSCDVLLNLFAPFSNDEFLRVLKDNGLLFMVIPSTNHLWQLKCAIYDTPYKNDVKDYSLDGFNLIDKAIIKDEITLSSNEDIQNLFMMTPYYYKTSIENTKKLENLQTLTTEIEFEILVYKKSK